MPISQLAICPEKTIIRRPAATARSTCSKPCVSTRPPRSNTLILRRCGYSAATRPRLSHMPVTIRSISASESSGKARLRLRRASLETPRKGPTRRASAPPRAEARPSDNASNTANKGAALHASRRSPTQDMLAVMASQVAPIAACRQHNGRNRADPIHSRRWAFATLGKRTAENKFCAQPGSAGAAAQTARADGKAEASVQPRAVALGGLALGVLDRAAVANLLGDDAAEGR